MNFDLPVKGDKVRPQQVTALHLFCGLAFIGTGAIIYVYNFDITYWGLALLLGGIALSLLTIVKNKWVTAPTVNVAIRIAELLVSLAIFLLSLKEQWKFPIGIFGMLTAAILFSIYWERGAGQQLFVQVNEQGIHLPVTSRRRHIPWTDVAQVLLRYGILSVDCVDNKLYQLSVSAGSKVDPGAFEAFCSEMVSANEQNRVKNDW